MASSSSCVELVYSNIVDADLELVDRVGGSATH